MNTYDYVVNKYNIKVGRQYFVHVPQIVGSEGLAALFKELGFNRGVEIGTDQGEYAEVLCKLMPNLSLYCVDPWTVEAYKPGEQPESFEPQEFFDRRYEETAERLKPFPNVWIKRTTSVVAAEDFEDQSLDFVYIDGNHDFLNVIKDIEVWKNKVRPGGIVAGHDYVRYPSGKFNHVQRAVQAYACSYHMLPIFNVAQTKKGLRRDRFRSWFYIKPWSQ